ncbi:MAG: hypothetical protein AAGB22_00420, partial [Bacteroidota bacterium]
MISVFRHSLFFLLLVLCGASCSSPENEAAEATDATTTDPEATADAPPRARRTLPETLELSQYRFDFDTVPESEYRAMAMPLIAPDPCDYDYDCYEA